MEPYGGKEHERWRGQIDARIDDLEDGMKDLWRFKDEARNDIAVLKTKIIIFSAIGAVLGGIAANLVAAAFK